MITREEIIWAYKILLNRSPENEVVILEKMQGITSLSDLKNEIINSDEYVIKNFRQTIYEPNKVLIAQILANKSLLDEFNILFRKEIYEINMEKEAIQILETFKQVEVLPQPGFVTEFLGNKTDISFRSGIAHLSGLCLPKPYKGSFHADVFEWAGCLKSVLEAKYEFIAIELGCGWGPWLVNSISACQQMNIENFYVLGVEANQEKLEFLEQHMLNNGISESSYETIHSVVSDKDGMVSFPEIQRSNEEWGQGYGKYAKKGSKMILTKSLTITSILQNLDTVDLLHIDIQGAELESVTHSLTAIEQKVKRLIIGTHSKSIDIALIELLCKSWTLEFHRDCKLLVKNRQILLIKDGTQVWRNNLLSKGG